MRRNHESPHALVARGKAEHQACVDRLWLNDPKHACGHPLLDCDGHADAHMARVIQESLDAQRKRLAAHRGRP